MRACITDTLERPSNSTASERNRAFLPVLSIKVKETLGMAIANGIPGSPPPEPMSATFLASSAARKGSSERLSAMCFTHASAGSLIAVKLNC